MLKLLQLQLGQSVLDRRTDHQMVDEIFVVESIPSGKCIIIKMRRGDFSTKLCGRMCKGPTSGLRKFLTTESPLKMIKMLFIPC